MKSGNKSCPNCRIFQHPCLEVFHGLCPPCYNLTMNNYLRKDLAYNWHPYTQMKDHEELPPIFVKKAKGIKLYDNKGNWYYDTISSWWCNIHGHNHPHIVKAINDQLKKLDHVLFAGFTHEPAIRLSEKLISVAPVGLSRVFYSDNGSTAVETAIKMSLQYWNNTGKKNKTKFVSLDLAYHGDTSGAMSLGGVDIFNKVFTPLFFKSLKVPSPYCYRCPMNYSLRESSWQAMNHALRLGSWQAGKISGKCSIDCIKPLEQLLKKKANQIAGFIIEPLVMGAAGMIIYPKEYLQKAAALAKKYNIHLIADEVAVGFGRTGKMFACQVAGISPDFMCLSKGLTSGTMALGATLATEKIYRAFYSDYKNRKTFYHGHTFTANPIACSAALASLEIFKNENTLNNVAQCGALLKEKLEAFKTLPFVGDVRSIGMIGAIELVKNKKTKEPFAFEERAGYKIYKKGLKKNILLRPIGDVIYLYLPLCVKKKELIDILDRTYTVIASLE